MGNERCDDASHRLANNDHRLIGQGLDQRYSIIDKRHPVELDGGAALALSVCSLIGSNDTNRVVEMFEDQGPLAGVTRQTMEEQNSRPAGSHTNVELHSSGHDLYRLHSPTVLAPAQSGWRFIGRPPCHAPLSALDRHV